MNNEDSKINKPNNRPDNKIHQEVESKQKPDKTKTDKPPETTSVVLTNLGVNVQDENTLFLSLGIGTIIGLLIYYYKG